MPIINLKISGKEDVSLAQTLASSITLLTQQYLDKKPEATAITITFIPDVLWFINGQSVAGARTFYLDIKVSDSTNLKDQKAAYIEAVYKLFEDVHPLSYVYVEEVKGDAYGFGGLTMEHRYINKKQTNE
jgi:4-oxalocrotonate tautomerase